MDKACLHPESSYQSFPHATDDKLETVSCGKCGKFVGNRPKDWREKEIEAEQRRKNRELRRKMKKTSRKKKCDPNQIDLFDKSIDKDAEINYD